MSQAETTIINFIVIGLDLHFAKQVQTTLNGLQATNPTLSYRVFPGADKEKLLETLNKYEVHSILVEEEFLDAGLEQWLHSFRETIKETQNKDVPLVLVSSKTAIDHSKQAVKAGFADVLIKPVDNSLLTQKLSLANSKVAIMGESQLFTMEIKQNVDLGFSFKTISVSEFAMTIQADQNLQPGAILSIYTSFLENTLAAQVREVKKIDETNFQIFLLFIGLTPSDSQNLRKWMKQEYAQAKAAS